MKQFYLLLLLCNNCLDPTAWAQDSTLLKPVRHHRPFPPRPHRAPPFQGDGVTVKPFHNLKEIYHYQRPDYHIGLLLGTDVLSLVEPDGGPSVAAEYRLFKFLSVGLTTTFLLYSTGGDDKAPTTISGIRLTPDIKFFLPGKKDAYHLFFGVQGLYKQAKYWGHINNKDEKYPDGSFVPEGNYRRSKYIWGISPTFGIQHYLGKAQRLQLEFTVGFGLRYRYENWYGVGTPTDGNNRGKWLNFFNPDIGGNIHIPLSLRFVYRL
ncbi:Protein of unknown function [Chitinophaga costaii]|uniref:Outer membrane protein beta-barrel domain-containing protein n=1 Tax=Chitinophaga costaii TaxID=1335309 RepID=A0A1C4FW69_9BACT|nr:DUF3575 domain-containing protein [Chitinophaga costaii]PUZ27272.1 DUF3575 domain-containing protein [Chitinophaga costaii]SCC60178.1 Protein of unknown function [Chitinophaga costaii]